MSAQTDRDAAVNDKRELIAMLEQAAELEHALCCQYLYAALTLKRAGEPGISASQAVIAGQWEQQITKVALQEMYHLLLANNLLTAVDASPRLSRPNFPQPRSYYSDIDLPSVLTSFSLDTVSRFMCWEKPEETGWWDDWCRGHSAAEKQRLGLAAAAAEPPPYSTIGQLYGVIDASLQAHGGWIDPKQAARQVTSAYVPFSPKIAPITTSGDAHEYIQIIVSEGEGTPDWDSMSHFAYFHQIVDQLGAMEGFTPAWPTVDNPIYDAAHAASGTTLIDDPAVNAVGVLFNDLYLLMLTVLGRVFVPHGEGPEERRALANAALVLMPLGIKPLGMLLARVPAGDDFPGSFAGPSFELPDAVAPPDAPHAEAFVDLHARMTAVAGRCRLLSMEAGGLPDDGRAQLAVIAARLETLVPMFDLDRLVASR